MDLDDAGAVAERTRSLRESSFAEHDRHRCLCCVLLAILSLLAFPCLATNRLIDTGLIRISVGQGGFIDEVHLDRNGDGTYASDELIARLPAGEPALVVSYIAQPSGTTKGVLTGEQIKGKARVDSVNVRDLRASIKGTLTFDNHGSSPFEVTIQGQKNSAVLGIDLSLGILNKAEGLALKEASLRLYGVFDQREPGTARRSMSTGDFRNTPRPESSYQPLVWQQGGHLVESPWYWRNWTSWSESTGPVTVQEGPIPAKELTFFMRDDRHGIQAALIEPAAVSPFELAGNGYPANLGLFAWSPRVSPLPMHAQRPDRLEIKGIGLHFFPTALEPLANKGAAYWKQAGEVLEASRQELLRTLQPARRNLPSPRHEPALLAKRLDELRTMPHRGWDANVAATRPLNSAVTVPLGEMGPGWVEVQLDTPPATNGTALPARGGIPFPPGTLKSPDQLRLLDAQNREIAIQADPLAVWPDGSIKWILITLLSDKTTSRTLRLEYGPHVIRTAFSRDKLEIGKTPSGLTVYTGTLRFELSKHPGELFGGLKINASGTTISKDRTVSGTNTGRPNRLDLMAMKASADYAPYSFHAEGAQLEPSRAEIEDISVERQGPLAAHLLVKGRYRYATLGRGRGEAYRNEGNEFWIRYTVYAGQPYVEVKHSFVFEGNPDLEMIRDLSLSIPTNFSGTPALTFGTDGKSALSFSADRAGLYQDNPHVAEVWSANSQTHPDRIRAVTSAADGWMDASDGKTGVTFGVRNMREMYAKELSIDDGHLTVGLWPERARLLDTRRYARQYGDGESSAFGQGTAQGVARSHDLFFYFHSGDATAAESAQVARSLLQPSLIKAPPAWYAASTAAGAFHPRDGRQFGPWESLLDDGLDYLLYHRQLWSWFGFYDFGDMQQVPNNRGGWERLAGRWGWANNEALIDLVFYEQFMRTGRREYLDTALAMTRHTQEVDLINSNDYKGNHTVKMQGHRHNVNHWGDGYVGIRVAAPHGFRLGYYLTGDLRILDQLRMGMDAHWESMHNYDKEHSAGLGYLTFFWESTGDKTYRAALNAYLDFQVKHFDTFGHIHNGVWNFRKDAARPLPNTPLSGPPTDFFFQNFGAADSLMELAELTGREDLIRALIQLARDTQQQRGGTWEAQYCHYRLMAFAYRHTGDPVFLDYATGRADKLRVTPNRKVWAQGSAIERFDNKLSMLAWTGHGLPYLMQAMESRAKYPRVTFSIPATLPMPKGKTSASLQVDGKEARAREGTIAAVEWQVNGKAVSREISDVLTLPAGKHQVTLRATDSTGRSAMASQTVTVWEPGVVARLCFRGNVDGFVGGEYSETKGHGFTPGTRIVPTSEPRRHGSKGCPEVHITGSVKVKAEPGTYLVEMGGTDYWSERMGSIALQGKRLDIAIIKEATKKLSWSYTGEVTIGQGGILTLDFAPAPKGEPVVLAYVIVREKGQ